MCRCDARRLAVRERASAVAAPLGHRAYERGHRRGEQDHHDDRRAQGDGDPGSGQPGRARVDHERLPVGEGVDDHQGGEQRRRQQGDDPRRPAGQLAPAHQHRPGGLDRRADDREHADRRPDGGHSRSAPTTAAADAATMGRPGGTIGTSASASAAPPIATSSDRRLRSSGASRTRKKAGNIASSPSALGSPMADPASAPTMVPPTHPTNCGSVAPMRIPRSKRPSSLASAHDASTRVWPSAARRSGPPLNAGAAAMPIGRKRALTSVAATTAARTVPPSPSTEVEANCADPENTTIDMTIGAAGSPGSETAGTPNERPIAKVGRTSGSPARMPARKGYRNFRQRKNASIPTSSTSITPMITKKAPRVPSPGTRTFIPQIDAISVSGRTTTEIAVSTRTVL